MRGITEARKIAAIAAANRIAGLPTDRKVRRGVRNMHFDAATPNFTCRDTELHEPGRHDMHEGNVPQVKGGYSNCPTARSRYGPQRKGRGQRGGPTYQIGTAGPSQGRSPLESGRGGRGAGAAAAVQHPPRRRRSWGGASSPSWMTMNGTLARLVGAGFMAGALWSAHPIEARWAHSPGHLIDSDGALEGRTQKTLTV